MSRPSNQTVPAPDAAELRAALQEALGRYCGGSRPISRLERRPSAYRTSYRLEEVSIGFADGMSLELMFKDLSRRALNDDGRRAKPAFLYDPLREIEAYRLLLAPARLGTADCFGAVADGRRGRYWLFLERVVGRELYQVGEFETWCRTARWLAGMHRHFASQPDLTGRAEAAHLLTLTPDFLRKWMVRALRFTAGSVERPRAAGLKWLAGRYDEVIERLLAWPATVIHGEFYASNVLVQETGGVARCCPVDWEMAAMGPGLVDLAALTAGKWTEEQRTRLAAAYHADLVPGAGPPPKAFWTALDCCRLHLAVQWLGWSPGWSPPPEHAWDWLGEALALTEKLGF
jgi:hypothetical protein